MPQARGKGQAALWRIEGASHKPKSVESEVRHRGPVIAIDGPAGAGKSSIARELARRLGLAVLDTGAIYRSLALWALENDVSWDDERALVGLLETFPLRFEAAPSHPRGSRVFLGEMDVTDEIRSQAIGAGASVVSAHPGVRELLLPLQRRLSLAGCVAEGRDTGSVVFPQADIKFFLTASPNARARRRFAELQSEQIEASLEEVEREIVERDRRDASRATAPLLRAPDAILVDSSELTPEEVVVWMLGAVKRTLGI